MKTKFISEPIAGSRLWFAWDCTEGEFNKWVLKKFATEFKEDGSVGKTLEIYNEKSRVWAIWANDPVTVAHELIHFLSFTFESQSLYFQSSSLFC